MPQAGVRVLFQNADGSQTEVMTDATGIAKAAMPAGGNLSVMRPGASQQPPQLDQVFTYVGVKAGDHLQLGSQTPYGTPTTINVLVPAGAQGTVTVTTPCGTGQGNAPSVPVTVTGCPAMIGLFVEDQNQSSFYAHAPYAPMIDLSNQLLVDSLPVTLNAANIPTGATVTIEERVMDGSFALYSTGPQPINGAPVNVNVPQLTGLDALVITAIALPSGSQMVGQRSAFAPQPVTVDATASLIPSVSTPMATATGISWQEMGTGSADLVIATVTVTRAAGTQYLRQLVAAHAGTSLAMPMMTGGDVQYNPQNSDNVKSATGIVKASGGYDAARAYAFGVPNIVEATPSGGAITLSYAGNAPPGL